jgi:hypothetical protein
MTCLKRRPATDKTLAVISFDTVVDEAATDAVSTATPPTPTLQLWIVQTAQQTSTSNHSAGEKLEQFLEENLDLEENNAPRSSQPASGLATRALLPASKSLEFGWAFRFTGFHGETAAIRKKQGALLIALENGSPS